MRIIILGAYGYTGKIICDLFNKNGIEFSIAGKNINALTSLQVEYNIQDVHLVDLRKTSSITKMMNKADLFVNCAGPFTEESQKFVHEIAKSGLKYLDISGEIGFVQHSLKQNQEIALKSNTTIIHSCAFESMITDLAVHILAKVLDKIIDIKSFYWFDQKKVSPGSRLTMKLSPYRNYLRIKNGKWVGVDMENDKTVFRSDRYNESLVAVPYPLPEIAFNFWNYNSDAVQSFILLNEFESTFVSNSKKREGDTFDVLDKLRIQKAHGPSVEERSKHKSKILIVMMDINGTSQNIFLSMRDMYLITGQCILFAVEQIKRSSLIPAGVISPAKLFAQNEEDTLRRFECEIAFNVELSLS